MAAPTYLIGDYAVSYALPFVLVFTLVFAILQKTKLLGDNAKQANAIIALVIGNVVKLQQQFNWFKTNTTGSIFKKLKNKLHSATNVF